MRRSSKPVRKCYSCLLNQGDHCWIYRYPRGQWQDEKRCAAFENEEIYRQFCQWRKQPSVKSRKELRREFFRAQRRTHLHRGTQTPEVRARRSKVGRKVGSS